MKKQLFANLMAALVVMLSFMATVSYAKDSASPVPKETDLSEKDASFDVPVLPAMTPITVEALPDIGIIRTYLTDKKELKQIEPAETIDITPFIKRPEKASATHYGYHKRSWKKVYVNKIRPPNRTE